MFASRTFFFVADSVMDSMNALAETHYTFSLRHLGRELDMFLQKALVRDYGIREKALIQATDESRRFASLEYLENRHADLPQFFEESVDDGPGGTCRLLTVSAFLI